MRRSVLPFTWLSLALLVFAPSTPASEGVLQINQTCAAGPGCFPGDDPGYPVTILNSGSYRLTSNLLQPSPTVHVIVVGGIPSPAINNVTIDLNGYSILGETVCVSLFPTISCTPASPSTGVGVIGYGSNITVRNGTVDGMGGEGIVMNGPGSHVEKVHASSNGQLGIYAHGNSSISDCEVNLNRYRGIVVTAFFSAGARITGNVANNNGASGIDTDGGLLANNVVSWNNTYGIYCNGTCNASSNLVFGNFADGIYLKNGSVVGNTVTDNGGHGLRLEDGCASTCSAGYAQNMVTSSSGGAVRTVIGGVQMGTNICNGDTNCP